MSHLFELVHLGIPHLDPMAPITNLCGTLAYIDTSLPNSMYHVQTAPFSLASPYLIWPCPVNFYGILWEIYGIKSRKNWRDMAI